MNRLMIASPVVLLLIAGCGVKPPIQGRLDPYAANQIYFASSDLKNKTAVGTPIAQRDPDGNILYITVPIRSTTDLELHIDYRVKFFNKSGTVLSTTSWFTRTLAPNIEDYITVSAGTAPRAADFQMDFRYAK